MHNRTLEVRRTSTGFVAPDGNVIFDEQSISTPGISYDAPTGVITFNEIGQYSIKWWVATETAPKGVIEFGLRSSQGELILGSSPQKTGQVSGFAAIDVLTAGTTLSLVNTTAVKNGLSIEVTLKAYLLILPIAGISQTGPIGPQGVVGTVGTILGSYDTLADLTAAHPTGAPGEFYYVDPDLYVWDEGNNDWVNVGAIAGPQGIQGPVGPTGATQVSGIQAELTNFAGVGIANNGTIIFDNVLNEVDNTISYDGTNGVFTLSQIGNYLVNWWLSVDGTDSTIGVVLSLNVNGVSYSRAAAPPVTGQVCGSALVTVGAVPATLSVTNISGDLVTLEDSSLQAAIVIMAIPA